MSAEPLPTALAPASAARVSVHRAADFPPPGWQVPRSIAVSPDGKLITYLQSESQGETMSLFAYDLATREHRVLLRPEDLVASEPARSREEELRRERQRTRIEGITHYAWAREAPAEPAPGAAAAPVLLLPLGGEVLVRDGAGAVRRLAPGAEPAIDPQLCPTGTDVAFVRGRELHVVSVASGAVTELTRDAPEGVTRGLSDFIGQEEFAEPSGFYWSPRCDAIAYLEVDEREVDEVPVMGVRSGREDFALHRYPRVGRPNPKVRLAVVELATGRSVFFDVAAATAAAGLSDGGAPYLGRFAWSPDGRALYFQTVGRDQKKLGLWRADPKSGALALVHAESDDAWVELVEARLLPGDHILWASSASGHKHLELRSSATGALQATLTSGAWDVARIVAVDGERVLFLANREAPLERQLYALTLPAPGALAPPEVTRLTSEPGVHDIAAFRAGTGWVDVHSAGDRLPEARIVASSGETLGTLPVPLDADYQALGLRAAELVTLAAEDGTPLHGALLRPRDMRPGVRYPAVVMVYGGPGVQSVLDEHNPRLLWQHLADRGCVVFQLDNRGSTGRGHAFARPVAGRLGVVELADQLRGVDYLTSLPFVDARRLGIYGHSYGGYLAALAMLRAPGRFAVGVAGSPVTDWRLYDTGYTERYMGLLTDNAAGYEATALAPHAAALAGKLLIVHALMDENVHFAHTARLVDALVAADKDFDLLVFPGERHGYRSLAARRYAYRRVVDYLAAHL
ncbi:MAG: alpha/beta fold hydrolase [Myxococcales bacterium]|nr:alpha/beta fold hydrolase [Myxococcales bacterium]